MKKLFWILLLISMVFAENKQGNALIKEDSPYLQQHAHNPVNWYPWGEEAFAKAKKEHKLIFLSIGYSTCHWCHVMEEESFENKAIAKLLNDNYISIKVDREAYPQLDKKYQLWYRAFYGKRGGWPLSVFMSPDAKVFHLATYIPAEAGYGSKGLFTILPAFAAMYHNDQSAFKAEVKKYDTAKKRAERQKGMSSKPTEARVTRYMDAVKKEFDPIHGGFSKRPKFPEASKLTLLFDIDRLYGNKDARHMAVFTLKKMAEGGIYDQIGGGFFRYTTDEAWEIPHFEKMLYLNAELIPLYVKVYEMTKDPLYKKVVTETIAEMEKHFLKKGLYLTASDADSEGEEGGYFIYNYVKIKNALLKQGMKAEVLEAALAYLGIEEDGNIDGELSLPHITSQNKPAGVEKVKAYLKRVREKRVYPFVDEKVITSWNAMMIKALFSASKIDKKYSQQAKKRMNRLLERMLRDGILYHQVLLGKVPKQKALLEDYAFLIDALIAGYESSYDAGYLQLLKTLTEEAKKAFYRNGKWYLSHDGIEAYADFDDKYYTAALSLMLDDMVRVAGLSENLSYIAIVKQTLKDEGAILEKKPEGASKLLETFLRLKKGDVILKASKKSLLAEKVEIGKISYPFLLSKVEKGVGAMACKINLCFAYDKNITAVIKKIEERTD